MSTATATGRPAHHGPHGGVWREEVLDRAGRLRDELLLLPQDDTRVRTALGHVDEAVQLAEAHTKPAEWWSGGRVEACWRGLRRAEELILDVGTPSEVGAKVKDAMTHASFYLGDRDGRTRNLAALLDQGAPPDDLVPAARIALAASHEASDRAHRERRSFMNTLRVTAGLLVVLALLLLAAVMTWGWALIVTVDDRTQPELVGIAMMFGALGALFSAIPSIAQMPAKAEAFNPLRTQAALKVVVGAWSAVVGLMAVTAGLAQADMANLAGFAMVAALFGAGQEAITRFADHRAADLGSSSTTGTPTP